MKLFISWSGTQGRAIAEALRAWLPAVLQNVQPYFSPEDIRKGQRWALEIGAALQDSQLGLIVLTPDSLHTDWVQFEAGALSKELNGARVIPLLYNLQPAQVTGPLAQFRAATLDKKEFSAVVAAINEGLGDGGLAADVLAKVYDKWWPDLEAALANIPAGDPAALPPRPVDEMLEELLALVRGLSSERRTTEPEREAFGPVSVHFDEEHRYIEFLSPTFGEMYGFELDRVDSGSELLDWILQVNAKGFMSARLLREFVDLIEELSRKYLGTSAQGAFCPTGKNSVVEWPKDLVRKG
jgi:hypothetical protein